MYTYLKISDNPVSFNDQKKLIASLMEGKLYVDKNDAEGVSPLKFNPEGEYLFSYAAHKLSNVKTFVSKDLYEVEKRPWYECPNLFDESNVFIKMKMKDHDHWQVDVIRSIKSYRDGKLYDSNGRPINPEDTILLEGAEELGHLHDKNLDNHLSWTKDENL